MLKNGDFIQRLSLSIGFHFLFLFCISGCVERRVSLSLSLSLSIYRVWCFLVVFFTYKHTHTSIEFYIIRPKPSQYEGQTYFPSRLCLPWLAGFFMQRPRLLIYCFYYFLVKVPGFFSHLIDFSFDLVFFFINYY